MILRILTCIALGVLAFCGFYWLQSGSTTGQSSHSNLPKQCNLYFQDDVILDTNLGISPELLEQRGHSEIKLRIPKSYINPRSIKRYQSGQLDGAALLYAKLPDFSEMPKAEMGDPNAKNAAQSAAVLITTFVALEQILESSIKIWGRSKAAPSDVPAIDYDFALKKVDYEIFGPIGRETFFAEDESGVVDVFTCFKGGKFNTCDHYFDAGDVEIKLRYKRSNLPNWQVIRNEAQSFVDCIVNPTQSKP